MTPPIRLALAVGSGAALGSLLRLAVFDGIASLALPAFIATALVNLAGSLVIGFASTISGPGGRLTVAPAPRQFVVSGLCGGLTTFSTMSLDALLMLADQRPALATLYLALVSRSRSPQQPPATRLPTGSTDRAGRAGATRSKPKPRTRGEEAPRCRQPQTPISRRASRPGSTARPSRRAPSAASRPSPRRSPACRPRSTRAWPRASLPSSPPTTASPGKPSPPTPRPSPVRCC